jgi:heme exporter protein B
MIGVLIVRDLRRGFTGAAWLPIAFFLLVATLVPFAIGPDAHLLERIAPGALWIAALTAALLPIERLIEPDRADGVLDQLAVRGLAEESVALAKISAHWLSFAPLLLVAAVPASALLAMDGAALARVEIALAIGTPALAALGLTVSALTVGLRGAGALGGLLMLPLAVPILIFGAGMGDPVAGAGAVKLLGAASLLLVAIAPFAAGAAIRAARD